MPKVGTKEELAVYEAIGVRTPSAKNPRIVHSHSFMGGRLYVVHFEQTMDEEERQSANWVFRRGGVCEAFGFEKDLISSVDRFYKRPVAEFIFDPETIAGILALGITVAIVVMYYSGRGDVPSALSAALTAILGFYFGRAKSKK
jgi:hypothetical protein